MSFSNKKNTVIILFGVSGCGKTTIAKLLSEKLALPRYDADNFHPQANIDKMRNGIALEDKDRLPWLNILADRLQLWEQNGGAILACSALKEAYRKILGSKVIHIHWVLLSGSLQLISSRMKSRTTHFMPVSLLQSQFDALEIPDYGLKVTIDQDPEAIVNTILTKLNAYE